MWEIERAYVSMWEQEWCKYDGPQFQIPKIFYSEHSLDYFKQFKPSVSVRDGGSEMKTKIFQRVDKSRYKGKGSKVFTILGTSHRRQMPCSKSSEDLRRSLNPPSWFISTGGRGYLFIVCYPVTTWPRDLVKDDRDLLRFSQRTALKTVISA